MDDRTLRLQRCKARQRGRQFDNNYRRWEIYLTGALQLSGNLQRGRGEPPRNIDSAGGGWYKTLKILEEFFGCTPIGHKTARAKP